MERIVIINESTFTKWMERVKELLRVLHCQEQLVKKGAQRACHPVTKINMNDEVRQQCCTSSSLILRSCPENIGNIHAYDLKDGRSGIVLTVKQI